MHLRDSNQAPIAAIPIHVPASAGSQPRAIGLGEPLTGGGWHIIGGTSPTSGRKGRRRGTQFPVSSRTCNLTERQQVNPPDDVVLAARH